MNFSPWRGSTLWRHQNNIDVAFEVHESFYVKETGIWKLRVGWWNIGSCHDPWPIGEGQNIEIPESRRREWKSLGYSERGPAPIYVEA